MRKVIASQLKCSKAWLNGVARRPKLRLLAIRFGYSLKKERSELRIGGVFNWIDRIVSFRNSNHDNCSDKLSYVQDVAHIHPILSFGRRDIQVYVGSDGKIMPDRSVVRLNSERVLVLCLQMTKTKSFKKTEKPFLHKNVNTQSNSGLRNTKFAGSLENTENHNL